MITVGTTVVSGSPINGGGGGGAPSGTGVVTVTSGVFDTPSSTGDIVIAGVSQLVGLDPAGTAIISDGAGGIQMTSAAVTTLLGAADAAAARAAISADTALDQLPVAGALHHWRLGEASSPFADSGSSPVNMAYVAGTREYGRAGVYTKYGATMQRSTTGTDRCSATIAVPSGASITMGITLANEQALLNTPSGSARCIFSLDCAGTRNGILILTDTNGTIYVNVAIGGADTNIPAITVSWSRPFRVDVTRDGATGATLVYINGLLFQSASIAGTMGAVTLAEIGGSARNLVPGSALMMTDATVHTSVLSAATLLSRADTCRRLAGG